MLNVYFISEPALRSLPAYVPGYPYIRIGNCQGPVGPNDPTPSTFFFGIGPLKIILQIVDVEPRQSTKHDCKCFFVLLERRKAWQAFLQNSILSSVRRYLQGLGATDTGQDLSDYLEKIQSAN